jgi:hypothetical protein
MSHDVLQYIIDAMKSWPSDCIAKMSLTPEGWGAVRTSNLANENTGVNWLDAIISGMRNMVETGYMFPPDGQDEAEYTGKIFRLCLFVEISNTKLREGMESLTGKSYSKIVPPAFTMMGMTPQLYATKKLAFREIFEIVCLMIGLEVNVAKRNSPNHHGPFHLVVDPGLNDLQLDPDNPDYHKLIPPRIGLSRINYDLEDRPTTYTVCLTPPQGFVSSLGVMLEVKLLDPEGNSRTVPSGQRERTSDFEITGVWVMPADYAKEDVFQDITGQLVEGKMDIGNDDSFREYLKTWQ